MTVYEQNVERATRSELWAAGEEVRLTWQPEHTFVLRSTEGAEPGGASEGSQPVATPTVPPAPEPADIGA